MLGGLSDRTLRYIADNTCPYTRLFEWGAGESTMAFAERCAFVASVEHALPYYENVKNRLEQERLKNCRLEFKPPVKKVDPDDFNYVSSDYHDHSFEDYVRAIEAYRDEDFHIIVVDGRCRVRCVEAASPKLAPGGLLVLDDAQRYMEMVRAVVGNWECDAWSSGPPRPVWTMVWRKPKSA